MGKKRMGAGWNSMEVQWLILWASKAGAVGSIPGQGTKIPYSLQPKKSKKKNKELMGRIMVLQMHFLFFSAL